MVYGIGNRLASNSSWTTTRLRGALAALTALGLGAALAGCDTVGGARNGLSGAAPQIAEVAPDDPAAASANIASLTEVINRNPGSAEAYLTRGNAFARNGRMGEAIADFSQAIKLDPNNAAAYTNRALAQRQLGRNDAALNDFSRAIEVNPRHASAYLGRANLLRAQGQLDEAMRDLDQAIRLNPEGAQAFHARGLIYQKRGEHQRAVTDFDNAIDRDPFAGAPYQARGESLVAQGKYDKAIEDFNAWLNGLEQERQRLGGPRHGLRKAGQSHEGLEILPGARWSSTPTIPSPPRRREPKKSRSKSRKPGP